MDASIADADLTICCAWWNLRFLLMQLDIRQESTRHSEQSPMYCDNSPAAGLQHLNEADRFVCWRLHRRGAPRPWIARSCPNRPAKRWTFLASSTHAYRISDEASVITSFHDPHRQSRAGSDVPGLDISPRRTPRQRMVLPYRISPLFETIEDLSHVEAVLTDLLSNNTTVHC